MGFLDLFKKKGLVNINENEITAVSDNLKVMIDNLEGAEATDRIVANVRKGDIVFVKIKDLKTNNFDELKQCVSKLRTSTISMGGDIAGVGDDFVILTPSNIAIHRGE